MRILRLLAVPALVLSPAACIPYATGTTALPTPQGEVVPSAAVYFIPGGLERLTVDSAGGSYFGIDAELRYGIDARSDLGVRIPGLMGIILNYKRRIDATVDEDGPAVAYMVGAGIVNAGEHAHLEASLLASGRAASQLVPYGGVKAMQVIPLTDDAVKDSPTIGVFAGVRLGRAALGISPEIAVFYDRSALGLRDGSVIVVPSFTFHGDEVVRRIFGGPDTRGPRPLPPRPWP